MEVNNLTKTFTIEDCFKGESQFKIGLEFEKSDEEIRNYLRSEKRTDFFLELGPFSGYVSIKLHDQEIGEPSNYTYPAQHLAWLNSCSKYFLQNDSLELVGLSSKEIRLFSHFRQVS